MYLLNWKASSIKLDCNMFENDLKRVIIVKLDQALIMHASWQKLCQHIHFKLLQAKIMLISSLRKLLES